ncbi:MAG: DUF2334 domain-containing protein [Nitrospinaceae bacterium]
MNVLDNLTRPARVFFRDDDAGWADDQLFRLMEMFSTHSMPMDLAVIPMELNEPLADRLANHWDQASHLLGMHQHGFIHKNHETTGRKCEFGPSRSAKSQLSDLDAGKKRLADFLEDRVDPIFTPPWNRCAAPTVDGLKNLHFLALSRDQTAVPLGLHGLEEIPVHIDWFRKIKGERISLEQLGQSIADTIQINRGPVGIMLHHAPMESEDFHALEELLKLMVKKDKISPCLMRDVITGFRKTQAPLLKKKANPSD